MPEDVGRGVPAPQATKTMRLRYAGSCRDCGADLPAGVTAVYDKVAKTVQCPGCHSASDGGPATVVRSVEPLPVTPSIAPGAAGASARREYERRHDKREAQIRTAHPHLGGLILALSDDPQSTRAWDTGARGEEQLGRSFDRLAEQGARVLHDRRIRGTKANIDHIAVTATGVHVVDAKRYVGKRPSRRVDGGFFQPRVEKLLVGSSDRTKLVAGMQWQVERVRAALEAAGFEDISADGTLCFVDADWPMFGGTFSIDGVAVMHPKALRDMLAAPGPLDSERTDSVYRVLAEAFPVA